MSPVIPFDSWEEAESFMTEAEKRANASVTAKQREIVYGSYWLRAVPEANFFEYGRVLAQDEQEAHQSSGDVRAMRARYARGYRFGVAHSVFGPEGTFGDTHIAVIWPITEEEFNLAQGKDWKLCWEAWESAMLQRISAEVREAREVAASNDSPPNTGSPQEGS